MCFERLKGWLQYWGLSLIINLKGSGFGTRGDRLLRFFELSLSVLTEPLWENHKGNAHLPTKICGRLICFVFGGSVIHISSWKQTILTEVFHGFLWPEVRSHCRLWSVKTGTFVIMQLDTAWRVSAQVYVFKTSWATCNNKLLYETKDCVTHESAVSRAFRRAHSVRCW
jgi:hypothetical protein